jgi:hypothetical protein
MCILGKAMQGTYNASLLYFQLAFEDVVCNDRAFRHA